MDIMWPSKLGFFEAT